MKILFITFLLYHLLFKTKSNGTLSCGLFGGSGKINLRSITNLGIANDTRGGDGTGYYYGKDIELGVGTFSRFENLVLDTPIEYKTKSPLFIGHTRKATHGKSSSENTHPFLINNLVLAHNGQILNIDELCKNHGIDNSDIDVDSKALAMIIEKDGFDVLTEYIGWAALAMTFVDEPDVLYLYHGAFDETTNGKTTFIEERPLFFLQTSEALYFSSIESSLVKIRESKKQKVHQLPVNTIVKIKNGKFIIGAEIDVPRRSANEDLDSYRFPKTTYFSGNTFQNQHDRFRQQSSSPPLLSPPSSNSTSNLNIMDITKEPVPNFKKLEKALELFYHRGRHYIRTENGGALLAQGLFYADKDTRYAEKVQYESGKEVDFSKIEKNKVAVINGISCSLEVYGFYRGVMMQDLATYAQLLNRLSITGKDTLIHRINVSGNLAQELSDYSRYPITLLEGESFICVENMTDRKRWWFRGKVASAKEQKPRFSNNYYTITKGFLTNISDGIKVKQKKEEPTQDSNAFVSREGLLKFGWSDTVKKIAEEAHIPLVDAHMFSDIGESVSDELDRAFVLYAKDVLKKQFEPNSKSLSALLDEFICQEIFYKAYSKSETLANVLDPNYPSIEFYIDKVLEEDAKESLPAFIEDPVDNSSFESEKSIADALAEIEADEGFIVDLVENYMDENPLSNAANEFEDIADSEFSQEVAFAFSRANEVLLQELRDVCEKRNKTNLVEKIKEFQNKI